MSSTEGFKPTTLILAVATAIIATVVALEFYGLLRHNPDKDALPVGEFQAVFLAPGEDFRLSSKGPELHALCQDNYLVIASNTDPRMRGVLVDFKNRGIGCNPGLGATATTQSERNDSNKTAPGQDETTAEQ